MSTPTPECQHHNEELDAAFEQMLVDFLAAHPWGPQAETKEESDNRAMHFLRFAFVTGGDYERNTLQAALAELREALCNTTDEYHHAVSKQFHWRHQGSWRECPSGYCPSNRSLTETRGAAPPSATAPGGDDGATS